MAKEKITLFMCEACGAQLPKWNGQCPECGGWNTIVETPVLTMPAFVKSHRRSVIDHTATPIVHDLAQVPLHADERLPCGIDELDRVLGGGLVPGSIVLIGGDPGIGKSTLLLQAGAAFAESAAAQTTAPPVLYVTGEESPQQIKLRAYRLGLLQPRIRLLAETSVAHILAIAAAERPQVLIIDSIQTLFVDELTSAAGSVAQVRESAARLVRYAKQAGVTVFLIGHVTKEGALAGPRVLEHMVDTVLYFEGDAGGAHRLVRAIKNRFGAVNELGVFAMTDKGLRQITNPSAIFLSRQLIAVPGSAVLVTREGTRPLLVEIQALVDESPLANPRRVAVGLDQNRLAMLLAVLHRHGGVAMFGRDVFVNAVGGVRISETAADLAVLLAILSSERDRPLALDLAVFGEVGLSGEIRPVPNGPDRLREAVKHGMKQAIVPSANIPKGGIKGLDIHAVNSLREAIDWV